MPPRSMWHPGGSTTSPMRSSTSMSAGPGTGDRRGRGRRTAPSVGAEVVEGAVVAARHQGVVHGRVEQPVGDPPRLDRHGDDGGGVGAGEDRRAGVGVQRRQLAVGPEPAPAALDVVEEGDRAVERARARTGRRRRPRPGPGTRCRGHGSDGGAPARRQLRTRAQLALLFATGAGAGAGAGRRGALLAAGAGEELEPDEAVRRPSRRRAAGAAAGAAARAARRAARAAATGGDRARRSC